MSERTNGRLKVLKPSIDVLSLGGDTKEDRLVIRGIIDPLSIGAILVDGYQREVIGGGKATALKRAALTSALPDIELAMRGDRYEQRGTGDGLHFALLDPVYVVDGLQRISAIKLAMTEDANARPHIGAVIHIETNEPWERARFKVLNQERTRIAPGVLLRNECPEHPGLDILYSMCLHDDAFVLKSRVCWQQRMRREEIIQAMRLCRVAAVLHSRFSPGMSEDARYLPTNLDKQKDMVGPNIFRENVRRFFTVIDTHWSIRNITFRDRSPQIKGGFLVALAMLFAENEEFWVDKRLSLNARQMKKLGKFPLNDPNIATMSGGGGNTAIEMLYQILLRHFDKGRRINRMMGEECDPE